MGFKPAARLAGIYPKTRPIAAETPKETRTAGIVADAFICIRLPAAGVITHPSACLLYTSYHNFFIGQLHKTLLHCFHRTLYVSLDDDRQFLDIAGLDLAEQVIQ